MAVDPDRLFNGLETLDLVDFTCRLHVDDPSVQMLEAEPLHPVANTLRRHAICLRGIRHHLPLPVSELFHDFQLERFTIPFFVLQVYPLPSLTSRRKCQPIIKRDRVLDEHVLTPEQETALKAHRARLSGMDLYRRACKRLRKIRRIQAAYDKAKHAGEDLSPFAARPALALRATPSGTAGLHREGTRNTVNNQRISRAEERRLSVQYLANQKPPSYLQSVFSI